MVQSWHDLYSATTVQTQVIAVDRIWHTYDSHGLILALVSGKKSKMFSATTVPMHMRYLYLTDCIY
jgi:hypothetical protein